MASRATVGILCLFAVAAGYSVEGIFGAAIAVIVLAVIAIGERLRSVHRRG